MGYEPLCGGPPLLTMFPLLKGAPGLALFCTIILPPCCNGTLGLIIPPIGLLIPGGIGLLCICILPPGWPGTLGPPWPGA